MAVWDDPPSGTILQEPPHARALRPRCPCGRRRPAGRPGPGCGTAGPGRRRLRHGGADRRPGPGGAAGARDGTRPGLPAVSACEIAAAVRTGRTSAVAVAEAALARVAARGAAVNAFTSVLTARAMASAAAVDARIAAGEDPGPLAGVPYAAKNLFDLTGIPTLAGSRIRRDAPPATTDAFLVRRMDAAGAVCLGALNMDEFAYGFTTENSH
ncbi:MAG: hypothetical protein EON47_24475, partial [Acetobacteraceae bacterium]